MSKITLTVDTETKIMEANIDGVNIDNFCSISAYVYNYVGNKGKIHQDAAIQVVSAAQKDDSVESTTKNWRWCAEKENTEYSEELSVIKPQDILVAQAFNK